MNYNKLKKERLESLVDRMFKDYQPEPERELVIYTGFIGSVVFNYALLGMHLSTGANIYISGNTRGKNHYTSLVYVSNKYTKYDIISLGSRGGLIKAYHKYGTNIFEIRKGTKKLMVTTELTPTVVNNILNKYK